jgi:hypothetical protein
MASGLIRCGELSLPNELALLVLDHIEEFDHIKDRNKTQDHNQTQQSNATQVPNKRQDPKKTKYRNKTLCSLARTCSAMQDLAEERLYKTIKLLSVKDLHAIVEAFTHRRARVRSVQTLKILYQYKPDDLKDSDDLRTSFNECVAHMVNLRDWHIESPFDNNDWEKDGGKEWVKHDMECFRSALEVASVEGPKEANLIAAEHRLGKDMQRTVGLALLESLTIHSHGAETDFWSLGNFHCLFQHPALRHLHISCVAFPAFEIPELSSHINKTPLTSLIFDECELQPKSLLSILRTPARLKSLTLGENVFNIHRSRGVKAILSKNPSASLQALSAVAHSLESLTHYDPGWRRALNPEILRSIRPDGDGMRNFHSLKYMQCDTNSFLHQAIVMNRDLAPPSLETLRVHRSWKVPSDFWDQPPEFDHYAALPSLATLELMQSSQRWTDLSDAEYICDAERLRNRHAKAYKLSKAGINLKMFVELHKGSHLIPPYLYNEQVPVIECLYDASVVGFHRHIFSSTDETSTGPVQEPPETDQLGDSDIFRLISDTHRIFSRLNKRFHRRRRDPNILESLDSEESDSDDSLGLSDLDDEDNFELEDLDEDDDMELDLELDGLDDEFEDEFDEANLVEIDGQLYYQVWMEVSDEDSDDDGDDDEMHDAVEEQPTGGPQTGGSPANNS